MIRLDFKVALLIYAVLDVLCVGIGMGVPVFCVLLGFPVGWYLARRAMLTAQTAGRVLGAVLKYTIATCAFTFVVMAIIWGPCMVLLFDQGFDLAHFGHPMILFTPKASFIGWLVLMVFVSPCLQLLTTVFAAYLVVLRGLSAGSPPQPGGDV